MGKLLDNLRWPNPEAIYRLLSALSLKESPHNREPPQAFQACPSRNTLTAYLNYRDRARSGIMTIDCTLRDQNPAQNTQHYGKSQKAEEEDSTKRTTLRY